MHVASGLVVGSVGLTLLLTLPGEGLSAQSPSQPIEWPIVNGKSPSLRYRLDQKPRIDFGSAAGSEPSLLSGVVGATRFGDGSLAVGDAGNNRVVFIGTRPSEARIFGRRGDGPGEFKLPLWLGRCAPDEVGVFDAAHNSLTFVSRDGQLKGTLPFPPSVSFDQIVLCRGRTTVWILLNQPRTTLNKGQLLAVPTVLVRFAGGRHLDTIAAEGVQEYYVGKNVAAFVDLPLGKATLIAASPNAIYLCQNRDGLISVFNSAGNRLTRFQLRLQRKGLAKGSWQLILGERLTRHPFARTRPMIEAVLGEINSPSELPLFDAVRADARGNLWIRTYDNLGTPLATWLVVSQRGVPLAALSTPRNLDIREIGDDFVLGTLPDHDGVEHVVMFDLHRA